MHEAALGNPRVPLLQSYKPRQDVRPTLAVSMSEHVQNLATAQVRTCRKLHRLDIRDVPSKTSSARSLLRLARTTRAVRGC